MKALTDFGYVRRYHWAMSIEEVLHAVSYIGPVSIGVNWYDGMFAPDFEGLLRPTGKLAGGHATLLGAIMPDAGRLTIYNSWGKDWGRSGAADILIDDLKILLHEDGEFAVATKVPAADLGRVPQP